jgi:hypothetical protein
MFCGLRNDVVELMRCEPGKIAAENGGVNARIRKELLFES